MGLIESAALVLCPVSQSAAKELDDRAKVTLSGVYRAGWISPCQSLERQKAS
jgi:hypothetical protein